MGVKGLQSFLKANDRYLAQKVNLNNTNLVIDANNLLCLIYTKECLDRKSEQYKNDTYGGDLVFYGQVVREFFENLKKCDITPVLVFDGSVIGKAALREFVASKEKQVYSRGLERFNRAKNLDEFSFDDGLLLPQTLNTIFSNIVNEFRLRRIQTPYEADTHIARVANELQCPVLTNDSDFLIYSLDKGFAMLDFFDYKQPKTGAAGKSSIECLIYSQDKLAKSLPGFKKENMPFMSILLGNDYVDQGTFDRVMESICSGVYHGHFETRSYNHRKIANLLTWMRGRSLQECIEFVLSVVHHIHQPKLQRLIRLFMRNYRIEESDDFDAELEQIYPSSRVNSSLRELGQMPVTFLRKRMENDDLGSIALDMIFHNTHYNYSISDDFSLPSSSYVKFRPFSLALVLLRPKSYENLSVYKRQIQAGRDAFHIYDRVRGEYTKLTVRPMEELENFGTLVHLDCYSMITLEPTLKRNILYSCFRFNHDELDLMHNTLARVLADPFVTEATLCFLLLKYVGLETKLPPKTQFVNALMLTLFYYAALSGHLNMDNIPNPNAYGQFLLRLRPHAVVNNGLVYANKEKTLFRRIVHFISQVQAAYKAYCLVNSLLDHAYHVPRQDKFFNGTLIFRLTKMLRLGELTLTDLCQNLPTLADICDAMQVQVHCASA